MKIRTPTEFKPFKDGKCNIFTPIGEEKQYKFKGLSFDNKTLGFKRFYAAKAAQVDISNVISIPRISGIDNYDKVEIGDKLYDIELIQEKFDTNPPSIDLTLKDV